MSKGEKYDQNLYLHYEKQVFECIKRIEQLKKQNQGSDIHQLEQNLENLQKKIYSELSPWERVLISRHPSRPHTIDYVKNMADDFVELFGDRLHSDDAS